MRQKWVITLGFAIFFAILILATVVKAEFLRVLVPLFGVALVLTLLGLAYSQWKADRKAKKAKELEEFLKGDQ